MTDGVRITQAGNYHPRVTQTGDRRVTERAVMAQVQLLANTYMIDDTAVESIALAMNAQTHMASVPVQRLRSVQVHMELAANYGVGDQPYAIKRLTEAGEIRLTQADDIRITETLEDGIKLLRTAQAHWTVTPVATFGQNIPATKRLTEDGKIRHTQAGNIRVVEESGLWGNIFVRRPIFRLFVKRDALWHLINPFAHHTYLWKVPANVHIKESGVWRTVKTTQPRE